jgi:aspartyl-tRNA synthetase
MDSKGFNEFETPMLVKSTPGGARNYLVPSRLESGKFWALPESPQLFKQLLMVAGFEKYYQIARCLRDEDLRKDRQPEFTQLDVEMSFIKQDDIIELIEGLLKKLWKDVLNIEIQTPFPRMTYKEAMEKYGNDRPDIRKDKNNPNEYAFLWVVEFPLFQYDKENKRYVANHHPFTSPDMSDFVKDPFTARSWGYDIVLNGVEIGGGSIRIHNQDVQQKVFEILQISKEEQEKKFKFLLDALKFGAPPHGGIALGLDRLMQLMLNTESIRESIAFPKNSEGKEVMLGAPSDVTEQQLKELRIKVNLPENKDKSEDKKAKAKKK